MKRIHVLTTNSPADEMEGLITALAGAGMRTGWLDLAAASTGPAGGAPDPGVLGRAAEAGALRAVTLDGDRTVAVKRLTGPPVLRDLLREHFLGCAAVLVRVDGQEGGLIEAVPGTGLSEEPAPLGPLGRIEPAGDRWRVVLPDGTALDLAPDELAARLRRPRPFR